MGLVALVPLLHTSILPPSNFSVSVLLPQVQMTMTSMTLMPGITSTVIRIFQRCLNATLGVMLRLPIYFPSSLCTLMLPSCIATSQVFNSRYQHFFYSALSSHLWIQLLFSRIFFTEYSFVLLNPSTTFFHIPFPLSYFSQ